MNRRDLDEARNEEHYGESAVFSCPVCSRTFIVSSVDKHGRSCPCCAKSKAYVSAHSAYIQWPDTSPAAQFRREPRCVLVVRVLAAIIAVGFAVYSIHYGIEHSGELAALREAAKNSTNPSSTDVIRTELLLAAIWALAPPLWFFFEYWRMWKPAYASLEDLKFGQEIASKVWIAVGVVLALLYFGKP